MTGRDPAVEAACRVLNTDRLRENLKKREAPAQGRGGKCLAKPVGLGSALNANSSYPEDELP